MDIYEKEIKKAENRQTSSGFLDGLPKAEQQLYNLRSEEPTKEFLGIVVGYDPVLKMATYRTKKLL